MMYVMKSCWERPTWKACVEVENRVCTRSTYFRHTMRKLASFLITQNWSSFYPPNFDWHANTSLIQPRVSRLCNMHVSWTLKRLLIQYGTKAYSIQIDEIQNWRKILWPDENDDLCSKKQKAPSKMVILGGGKWCQTRLHPVSLCFSIFIYSKNPRIRP